MKQLIFIMNFIFLIHSAIAKNNDKNCNGYLKEITPEWVEKMKAQSEAQDKVTKRLQDVAQSVGFKNAAYNREILKAHNNTYTKEVCASPVSNQLKSGRCWIFASVTATGEDISQNYVWFFHFLEQANGNLEKSMHAVKKVKTAKYGPRLLNYIEFSEGGWQPYFNHLTDKYGAVPKAAMPETAQSAEDPKILIEELRTEVSKAVIRMQKRAFKRIAEGTKITEEELGSLKESAMKNIWNILTTHLGTPPTKFEVDIPTKVERDQKTLALTVNKTKAVVTPKEYAKIINVDPDAYVEVAASVKYTPNTYMHVKDGTDFISTADGKKLPLKILNVSNDRMKELVEKSIDNGMSVPFACDVLKDMDPQTGIMHTQLYDKASVYGNTELAKSEELTRAEEIEFGLTQATHEMVFVGYDKPDSQKSTVKYKVENSWSTKFGDNGFLHMYRDWFDHYVYFVSIPKSMLSEEELAAIKSKPVTIERDSWIYKVNMKNKIKE